MKRYEIKSTKRGMIWVYRERGPRIGRAAGAWRVIHRLCYLLYIHPFATSLSSAVICPPQTIAYSMHYAWAYHLIVFASDQRCVSADRRTYIYLSPKTKEILPWLQDCQSMMRVTTTSRILRASQALSRVIITSIPPDPSYFFIAFGLTSSSVTACSMSLFGYWAVFDACPMLQS
jgi:hypothetical protein